MAPDRGLDRSAIETGLPAHQRRISLLYLSFLKRASKCPVRLDILGDQHKAGGFLVQPMDESGSLNRTDAVFPRV